MKAVFVVCVCFMVRTDFDECKSGTIFEKERKPREGFLPDALSEGFKIFRIGGLENNLKSSKIVQF
ncbi:hypothetical protein [Methanimicrococcus blatticola]|uniref:hypothetical protein n=1 Tax=Methanimicrococcus blatticola TaxID=91560 RepID=UPI00141525FC|nr:hypothetical protein [Methanimicrococcus blatticola]MBZ3935355.1 hypothetical protein [Methanimicrococcus blatticola]MCC2508547.1 hypothetical protein [Methanimicrococcus blatticola]